MKALSITITTIAVLCITALSATAQKSKFRDSSKKFKTKYADQLNEGEKIKKSWYHYVTTETQDKEHFVRVFYPDTKQITSFEQYKSKKYKSKNGYCKYWTDIGILNKEGNYYDDKKVGLWKYYQRKEGYLSSFGSYINDNENGLWINMNSRDTSSIYNYIDGIKEGPFTVFDSLGNVSNEGIYRSDTIYSQKITPTLVDTTVVEQMPMFGSPSCDNISVISEQKKCADMAMLQYIYRNLKYPRTAREYGLQGRVIIQFVINKNGDIEGIDVINGICDDFKNQCIEILEGMPKWNPGMQNGKAVKVLFTIPILFKLE